MVLLVLEFILGYLGDPTWAGCAMRVRKWGERHTVWIRSSFVFILLLVVGVLSQGGFGTVVFAFWFVRA